MVLRAYHRGNLRLKTCIYNRNCLANAQIAIPAFRLLRSIAHTKPRHASLGVCLQGDSTLRLNATLELYRRGKIRAIIVSGGAQEDLAIDEMPATSMSQWLIARGVPREKIWLEPKAKTTYEHAALVCDMVDELGEKELLIITSGYHLLRAYLRFLHEILRRGSGIRIFGHPAGDALSWVRKTPTGNRYRLELFFCSELTKIRKYTHLASFTQASNYIPTVSLQLRSGQSDQ
jgi:uncharacterized SAM-binding protein YcdF (DUF218 family)